MLLNTRKGNRANRPSSNWAQITKFQSCLGFGSCLPFCCCMYMINKNKSSCLEELHYQNVLQKATCRSANSSAHKLNQYYFTLWASWFFPGGRKGRNTEQNFIRGGGGSVPQSNPLPFYIPFWTEKIPLSYTFY